MPRKRRSRSTAGVEVPRRKGKQGSGMSANALYEWRMTKRVAVQGTAWYQKDAAKWYGVSERQWRRWENGEVPIPVAVVLRIAEYEVMRQALRHSRTQHPPLAPSPPDLRLA